MGKRGLMEKLKTISIHGKEYITVAQRVLGFNEQYLKGSISTEVISDDGTTIQMKTTVWPDASDQSRCFTGFSEEVRGGEGVNKVSAVENAETSAVGRALGMMGIGIIDGIATADEVSKAVNATSRPASDAQKNYLKRLDPTILPEVINEITDTEAASRIQALVKLQKEAWVGRV
jgi:hypothetical protein